MRDRASECERKKAHYYLHKDEYKKRAREYAETHREYINELQRTRYKVNSESKKKARANSRLRCKYGLTIEKKDELIRLQGERCAICGSRDRLVVDHSHATGKARALLCLCCNFIVGECDEDPMILISAIVYLIKHKTSFAQDYQGA